MILFYKLFALVSLSFWLNAAEPVATSGLQSDDVSDIRAAIKAGSAKELSKYLNSMVELNFDGDKASYSKTQAEFVLKDFFKKYPPQDFQYIHQGSSKEGLKYAIGKYSYQGGTYRVYLLIKPQKGNFLIDQLDFSKE